MKTFALPLDFPGPDDFMALGFWGFLLSSASLSTGANKQSFSEFRLLNRAVVLAQFSHFRLSK